MVDMTINTMDYRGFTVVDMGNRNWLYDDGRAHYSLEAIERADHIVDIGACFGGFTLFAAEACKKPIVAVEPLWHDVYEMNAELNGLDVETHKKAIASDIGWQRVNFDGRELLAKCMKPSTVMTKVEGKVFLKCDCEGGEWALTPADFKNVYRAEMELHEIFGIKANPALVKFLEETYFIEPGHEIVNANGRAVNYHLFRKSDFPEKKDKVGPISAYFLS